MPNFQMPALQRRPPLWTNEWWYARYSPFSGADLASEAGRQARFALELYNMIPQLGIFGGDQAAQWLAANAGAIARQANLDPASQAYRTVVERFSRVPERGIHAGRYGQGAFLEEIGSTITALKDLWGRLAGPSGEWGADSPAANYLYAVLQTLGPYGAKPNLGQVLAGGPVDLVNIPQARAPRTYSEWLDFRRRAAQAAALEASEDTPAELVNLVRLALSPGAWEAVMTPAKFGAFPTRFAQWWQ